MHDDSTCGGTESAFQKIRHERSPRCQLSGRLKSGAGIEAYNELLGQVTEQNPQAKVFPHPIAFNCIPQIGSFNDQGYTSEEIKVMKETKKIMRHQDMRVSAFTVRVPVLNADCRSRVGNT